MNGEMLEELRDISRGTGKINSTQFRLALAAIAEIVESEKEFQKRVEEHYTRIMLAIETQNESIEAIYTQMNEVKAQISTYEKCESRKIAENVQHKPVYRLETWITEHPMLVKVGLSIIGGLIVLVLVLWLVPGAQGLTLDLSGWPPLVGIGIVGK